MTTVLVKMYAGFEIHEQTGSLCSLNRRFRYVVIDPVTRKPLQLMQSVERAERWIEAKHGN